MTGARRTPRLEPLRRALCIHGHDHGCGGRARNAERASDADTLEEEDSRSLARRMLRPAAQAAARPWRRSREHQRELRRRPALPPHRGLEFMFEAQVTGPINVARQRSMPRSPARSTSCATSRRNFRSVPLHRQRAAPCSPPPMRRGARGHAGPHEISNGQQNAHRRDPSGGDPGGRSARQSRRRIRLRIRAPQTATRQHLSGESDAR